MKAQSIDIGGGRVVRIASYTFDAGDGDGPERRVMLVAGWRSVPLFPPAADSTVDIPADALPALLAALEAMDVD